MTWIKFPENHNTVDLGVLDEAPSDECLELNENGSCNVSKEVAEYLLTDYSGAVEEYETNND